MEKETTSSLEEILNSINFDDATKLNIVNYVDDNDNNNQQTNNDEQYKLVSQEIISELLGQNLNSNSNNNSNNDSNNNSNNNTNTNSNNTMILNNQIIPQQVQLLSNDIDRRIGNYLLNELEKKQSYIEELEEAVKFQEKEIGELRQKLDTLSKLDLLSKIKSNMDSKLSEVETNINQELSYSKEDNTQMSKPNKVVQVIKSQQTQETQQVKSKIIKEEDSEYPKNNPDLVFRSDPGIKVKSIPKEEEEPRYNGIMMLERPKQEEKIKIVLDYETDKNSEDIIKQRRRKARF